jgi:hypothetical protein
MTTKVEQSIWKAERCMKELYKSKSSIWQENKAEPINKLVKQKEFNKI